MSALPTYPLALFSIDRFLSWHQTRLGTTSLYIRLSISRFDHGSEHHQRFSYYLAVAPYMIRYQCYNTPQRKQFGCGISVGDYLVFNTDADVF